MKQKTNKKLIIGAVVIVLALVVFLVAFSQSSTQYFMTVEELQAQSAELTGKKVRISGAVLGDSIQYDAANLDLSFEIAQMPGDHREIEKMGGMAKVLEDAVAAAKADPSIPRLTINYYGVRPDLLKDEAQAIVTGYLDENGVFQASDLLLKCPSKYESALPEQAGE